MKAAGPINLRSLTSLRFPAAALVVGFHTSGALTGPLQWAAENVFRGGRSGVTLFFVLSGFVMAWSRRDHDDVRSFLQRRLARIYPAYFTAMVFAIIVVLPTRNYKPVVHSLPSFILIQSWIPDNTFYLAVNPVSWSLSCELFFYLLFPAIVGLVASVSATARTVMMYFAAGAAVLIGVAGMWAGVQIDANGVGNWLVVYFPPTRFVEFFLGIVLAVKTAQGELPNIRRGVAVVLACAALAAATILNNAASVVSVPVVPFAVLIVACAQYDLKRKNLRVEPSPWSEVAFRLGVLSYCIYLVHVPVFRLESYGLQVIGITKADGGRGYSSLADMGFIVSLLGIVAVWLAATALHRRVERPCERRFRGDQTVSKSDGV